MHKSGRVYFAHDWSPGRRLFLALFGDFPHFIFRTTSSNLQLLHSSFCSALVIHSWKLNFPPKAKLRNSQFNSVFAFFSAVLSPRNAARAGLDSAAGLLRADAAARVQLWRLWLNLNFSISADAAVCVESHSLFLFACRNMIVYALINPRKKRLHIDILTVCDRCCDFLLLNLSISISCHPSTDHACIYVFLRITRRDDYMCVLHVKILFKIAPKKEKFLQHNKPFLVLLKICGFLTSQNEHLILPVPRGELKCCCVYPAGIRFFAIACYHVRNFMDLQM